MSQSRKHSAIEITMNYASGFIIAYMVYAFIVMPVDWLASSPFWVTTLYTGVSMVRSYIWRRLFNRIGTNANQPARERY